MTEDPKKRRRLGVDGLDVNLDALLGSLGQALSTAINRLDQAQTSGTETSQTVETPFGPITTSAGFRVRSGGVAAGKATADAPKPVNPSRAAPASPSTEPRELVYDIFEDDDAWILTADMPGVGTNDVMLSQDGTVLVLTTSGARAYHTRIALPCPCPLDQISRNLSNGVLTLAFPKGVTP
jgi:HSP20 family molecular chaperone IbpA